MTSTILALALYLSPTTHKDGWQVYDLRTNIPVRWVDNHPRPVIQWRP